MVKFFIILIFLASLGYAGDFQVLKSFDMKISGDTLEVVFSLSSGCVLNAELRANLPGMPVTIFENTGFNAGTHSVALHCGKLSGDVELFVSGKAVAMKKMQEFGRFGSADGKFKNPSGLSVDPFGYIYVVDTGNDRIQKFDTGLHYKMQWGGFALADEFEEDEGSGTGDTSYSNTTGYFNQPSDIVVTRDIFVTDTENNRVMKFDLYGNFLRSFGTEGSGKGEFSLPQGIAEDKDGYIYIVDSQNERVQKFNSDGGYIMKFGYFGYEAGQFSRPTDIAIDSSTNIYVVDTGNNRIQKFNEFGTFLESFDAKDYKFSRPRGIAVDSFGILYVADSDNNRIVAISSDRKMYAEIPLSYRPLDMETIKGVLLVINSRDSSVFVYANPEFEKKLNFKL